MKEATAGMGGRRAFFRWLARESVIQFDELRGRPQLRLSDLPQLPVAQVAALKPGIVPGVEIIPAGDRVLARLPKRTDAVTLFSLHPMQLAIFNRFNGMSTLAEVAESVCAQSGQPPEEVFAATRSLFLRLAALGVCAPVNTTSDSSDDPGEQGCTSEEPLGREPLSEPKLVRPEGLK
ncbi:MAG: hypothetical protein LAN70_02590 [Acidobacteriia bacterium]|nr:hypothetical protein [Terriglobia bacterium]